MSWLENKKDNFDLVDLFSCGKEHTFDFLEIRIFFAGFCRHYMTADWSDLKQGRNIMV